MSETHPTTARSSLRWALLILVVIAIAALLWWLWPAPNNEAPQRPGGRPGFGAFGGAVPVRVAKVEQGEFEVFNK
ncbi:MAG TPA: multidrug transporter subunit MdtA, partial [Pseudomonas sp.]|nr:multidrug transporter subunit MdtA [Pseudomonas sp.]